MTDKEAVDELFEIRTAFLIGSYQQCINEAQKIRVGTNVINHHYLSYIRTDILLDICLTDALTKANHLDKNF